MQPSTRRVANIPPIDSIIALYYISLSIECDAYYRLLQTDSVARSIILRITMLLLSANYKHVYKFSVIRISKHNGFVRNETTRYGHTTGFRSPPLYNVIFTIL